MTLVLLILLTSPTPSDCDLVCRKCWQRVYVQRMLDYQVCRTGPDRTYCVMYGTTDLDTFDIQIDTGPCLPSDPPPWCESSDVNGDGHVDLRDAAILIREAG